MKSKDNIESQAQYWDGKTQQIVRIHLRVLREYALTIARGEFDNLGELFRDIQDGHQALVDCLLIVGTLEKVLDPSESWEDEEEDDDIDDLSLDLSAFEIVDDSKVVDGSDKSQSGRAGKAGS